MHPHPGAPRPGTLQDRRLADTADAFYHVELGQTVALRLKIWLAAQVDGISAGKAADRFQPVIGQTVRKILGRGLDAPTSRSGRRR